MKKIFSLMLLLATMISLTACGSDNEPSVSISKDQLVGIWDATAVQFNNDGKWIDITNRPDLALSIYFYEDGEYYGAGALGYGDGTYTLSGNIIRTYIDGELYATYVIDSLTGDIAELSITIGKESMLVRAKKSKISLKPSDPSIVVSKPSSTGGTRFGGWRSEVLSGDHYVIQSLCFNDIASDLQWVITDYTINENGIWRVEIDGVSYRATLNSQTITNYLYSFDGKTLVVRDSKTNKEDTYTATITGNKLLLSNGKVVTTFDRIEPSGN